MKHIAIISHWTEHFIELIGEITGIEDTQNIKMNTRSRSVTVEGTTFHKIQKQEDASGLVFDEIRETCEVAELYEHGHLTRLREYVQWRVRSLPESYKKGVTIPTPVSMSAEASILDLVKKYLNEIEKQTRASNYDTLDAFSLGKLSVVQLLREKIEKAEALAS